MDYTNEKTEHNVLKTTMVFTNDEWSEYIHQSYDANKSQYTAPGFRKGRVPFSYLVKIYGKEAFYEDAIEIAYKNNYYAMLGKENYDIADAPAITDVKFAPDGGVSLSLEVPLRPVAEIADYKEIKLDKIEYNVTDEDVEKEIQKLRERNSREIPVTDRAAKDGDVCKVSIICTAADGEKVDGKEKEINVTVGKKEFMAELDDAISGMNTGDTKEFSAVISVDTEDGKTADKKASYSVKLLSVSEIELPEVNDEFIKDATGEETLEAFKEKTRKKLQDYNEKLAKEQLEEKILDYIMEKTTVEIPDFMVEREVNAYIEDLKQQLKPTKLTIDDYLEYIHTTMDELREKQTEIFRQQIKRYFMVSRLIELENITVTDEEVEEKIKEQAKSFGEPPEKYRASISEERFSSLKNTVAIDKLIDHIVKNYVTFN